MTAKRRGHIFRKYIILNVVIITLSFLLLGTVLLAFMSNYWKKERSLSLEKTVQNVSYLTQNNMVVNNNKIYITNFSTVQGFIEAFSKSCDADLLIVDTDGNIIMSSNQLEYYGMSIPSEIMDEWQEKQGYDTSDLGIYDSKRLVASYPVVVATRGKAEVVATVFAVADKQFMDLFIEEALEAIIIIFILVFVVSSLSVAFFNYQTHRPIKEIAVAVEAFTKGDFSKRVNVKSNDEIGDLAVAFNNMAETLSLSENVRRSFVANVSHELKTPMTTISGFIDGIIDGTIPKEKELHYLQIVSDEIKRLSRLVRMMLDLSRIDNGESRVNKERFNIIGPIAKILIGFEKMIDEKKISILGLEDTGDVTVYADSDMIYQVLYNLIENAIKFANEGGYIEFSINSRKFVQVRIKNSGMGISKEDCVLIFDRFYKIDKSRSKDKNGMGLGLFIVKKLINLNGGEISVDSKEGEYTEFCFFLPTK